MELDELKYQLRDKLATDQGRSVEDIAALLTKRTASVTAKLKRSLWIEIISCMAVLPVFIYLALTLEHAFRIYFTVFLIVFAVLLIVLFYLLQSTRRLSAPVLPVKRNLEALTKLMEEFMKRYFQFTMLLIPVSFAFVLVLLYAEKHGAIFQPSGHGWFSAAWQIYLFMFAYVGTLTVFIYYFTKWYLKKLYGKYVEELKGCVEELAVSL